MAQRFAGVYQRLTGWNIRRTLTVLKPVYGLMKGIPTEQPLYSTYWRKRNVPPPGMGVSIEMNHCSVARKMTGLWQRQQCG